MLEEQQNLYQSKSNNLFLFLTKYRGQANPISIKPIEKTSKKYTTTFTQRRQISPHKIRHSFTTGFFG